MDLQRRSMITSDEIYRELCRKIENLDYMPGNAISENELCAQYDTSRHVVRGAISMLRQRRLLEVYPQRGSFVSLIDMDYVSDLVYMREAIEQEAVVRILEQGIGVDEVCEKMEACIHCQKAHQEETIAGEEFHSLDTKFHEYLLEAAGKKDIMKMMDESYIHFRRWRNLELRSMITVKQVIDEHEEIVRALKARDRQEARRKIHTHIDKVDLFYSECKRTKNEYFYKR